MVDFLSQTDVARDAEENSGKFLKFLTSLSTNTKMFANALRSQARLGLRTAVRTALPATRALSALAGTRVAVAAPSSLARLVVSSRAFSRSAPVFSENSEYAEESDTIFVGSIPWSTTKDEIQELFSEFGPVANVRVRELSNYLP